jgi:hypothetical protein
VDDAAQVALDRGNRTAVAMLDLTTGVYSGAGEDTAAFPSQSVVKVFLAVELLLTGQMNGTTEATAYRMVTSSDDRAATALYARAGGDDVVPLLAAHYGIPDLGAPPPVAGRWGLTRITAKGLVTFYAAVARDPAVQPWLSNAMGHAVEVAADGTDQFFGLPAAAPGAAIKQGWGHDGVDAGNAVANSTGYVGGGRVAVAILTSGPAATYGAQIESTVTAQARALLPGADAAAAAPAATSPPLAPAAAPATAGEHSATTVQEALPPLAGIAAVGVAVPGVGRLTRRVRRSRAEARARRARRRRTRRAPPGRIGPGQVVRLPSGQLVRITTTPGRAPATGRFAPRPARRPAVRPRAAATA